MKKRLKPRVELNDEGSVYVRVFRRGRSAKAVELFVEHDQIAGLISDLANALAAHGAQLAEVIDLKPEGVGAE
jgi:hypothetical protein